MADKEKAKAYEAALEAARKELRVNRKEHPVLERVLGNIFPELRVIEDERIRKMLVERMERWKKCAEDNNVEQDVKEASAAIAYLEKQKELFESRIGLYYYDGEKTTYLGYPTTEENPYDFAMSQQEKQKGQRPTPKFKIGDVMRTKQEAAEGITDGMPMVVSIDEDYYICNNEKIPIINQDEYEFPPMNTNPKPAEWSEEEKQKLDRIYSIIGWAMDEHAFSFCKKLIGDKEGVELQDFLRSIAKPKQWWGEEDEKMIDHLIESLPMWATGQIAMLPSQADEYVKRLKSLKNRGNFPKSNNNSPSWKPSEEQMEALER